MTDLTSVNLSSRAGSGVPAPARNACDFSTLRERALALREALHQAEGQWAPQLRQVQAAYADSARNLVHWQRLREADALTLQADLLRLGLLPPGAAPARVLAGLDKVLGLLSRLAGLPQASAAQPEASASEPSVVRPTEPGRRMVTLDRDAAQDVAAVKVLVEAGMELARIDCASHCAADWLNMAALARRAAQQAGRPVRIVLDLAGARPRTGAITPRQPVLKLKPVKDTLGRVLRPARLHLRPIQSASVPPDVDASVGVWDAWMERLHAGMSLDFVDARGVKRHMQVVRRDALGALAECQQTAYLTPQTVLSLGGVTGKKKHSTLVCQIDNPPAALWVRPGDHVLLTRPQTGPRPQAPLTGVGSGAEEALQIPCTLAEVIEQVQPGQRIWFDGGRVGGVIRETGPQHASIEITHTRAGGDKLLADQRIHLPDTALRLPSLCAADLEHLAQMASSVDMVCLPRAQQPDDVHSLRQALNALGRQDVGLMLRIETLTGFENLPQLLLAAMTAPAVAVVADGRELALACGGERLAALEQDVRAGVAAAHLPWIDPTGGLDALDPMGMFATAKAWRTDPFNERAAGVAQDNPA